MLCVKASHVKTSLKLKWCSLNTIGNVVNNGKQHNEEYGRNVVNLGERRKTATVWQFYVSQVTTNGYDFFTKPNTDNKRTSAMSSLTAQSSTCVTVSFISWTSKVKLNRSEFYMCNQFLYLLNQ